MFLYLCDLHSVHGCVSEPWRCTYVVMKTSQQQEDVPQKGCWRCNSCARPCWRTSNHGYSMVLRCLEKWLIRISPCSNPCRVALLNAHWSWGYPGQSFCANLSVCIFRLWNMAHFDGHGLLAVSVNIYQSSILHSAILQNKALISTAVYRCQCC